MRTRITAGLGLLLKRGVFALLASLMVAAGLTTGCGKIRQAVKEAVAKKDGSGTKQGKTAKPAGSSTAGGVFKGLERLTGAREQHATVVGGGAAEIRPIGATDFESFVAPDDRLTVVDFYADWCGPCRSLGPVLEKVVGELGARAALGKVNVDREQALAGKWGVRGIPDVRVFRGGKQVDGFVGALGEPEVRARLEKQLALLPAPTAAAVATAKPAEGGGAEGQPKAPAIQRMEKNWRPPGIERR